MYVYVGILELGWELEDGQAQLLFDKNTYFILLEKLASAVLSPVSLSLCKGFNLGHNYQAILKRQNFVFYFCIPCNKTSITFFILTSKFDLL